MALTSAMSTWRAPKTLKVQNALLDESGHILRFGWTKVQNALLDESGHSQIWLGQLHIINEFR